MYNRKQRKKVPFGVDTLGKPTNKVVAKILNGENTND